MTIDVLIREGGELRLPDRDFWSDLAKDISDANYDAEVNTIAAKDLLTYYQGSEIYEFDPECMTFYVALHNSFGAVASVLNLPTIKRVKDLDVIITARMAIIDEFKEYLDTQEFKREWNVTAGTPRRPGGPFWITLTRNKSSAHETKKKIKL